MMEKMRRLVRNFLGYDSLIYSNMSKLANFLSIITKEGIATWYKLRQIEGLGKDENVLTLVQLSALRYPVNLRSGTRDVETIVSTIVRAEYAHHAPKTEPVWMVDAGAYIGDTAAYFLSRYPNLTVVALEPNPESYALAGKNLAPYGDRAILLNKGLWGTAGKLCFGGNSTGASIQEQGNEIDAVSISSLMYDYSMPYIDILKMDIEGGEESVFNTFPEQWLPKVGMIIMEIHGQRLETLIADVLMRNGFEMQQYRSVWYCTPVK